MRFPNTVFTCFLLTSTGDWLAAVLQRTVALKVLVSDEAPGSEGNSSLAGTPWFAASNRHAVPSNHIASL